MLVVAGGDADPNVVLLARRAALRRIPHVALCAGTASWPKLTWALDEDRLWLDGVEVRPAALFLRYDVFAHLHDQRPESRSRALRWYHALLCWALAHEDVAFLNRRYGTRHAGKLWVLHLARRYGLAVPPSVVTSDPQAVEGLDPAMWIAKPVNGGEYTRILADARNDPAWRRQSAAEPTIIQQRLVGPDLRIYRVGGLWLAFALRSEAIDYRSSTDVTIDLVPAPKDLTAPLARLMDALGLDFGAADFKACPATGDPLFLEVNSAPMFAAFDAAAAGALADAILDWLAPGQGAAAAEERPGPASPVAPGRATGLGRVRARSS